MKKTINQILIIEDNLDYQEILEDFLDLTDFELKSKKKVVSLKDALSFLKSNEVDLVFLDIKLTDIDDLSSITKINEIVDVPIIVMTGLDNKEKSIEAINLGAQDYIVKGDYDARVLEKTIYHSLERFKNLKKLTSLNKDLNLKVKDRTALLEDAMNELREEVKKRQLAQDELRTAQIKLEESYLKEIETSELKSKMILTISHEYRNPLQNILTTSYILENIAVLKNESHKKIIDYTDGIRRSVFKIIGFIDEALEIGNINSDVHDNNPQTVEIVHILQNIVSYLAKIDPSNKRVYFDINEEYYVENRRDYLQQIFIHLINNALKYSPKTTEVKLKCYTDNDLLNIMVIDKGIGIDEKEQDKIFDDFYRADNAADYHGHGLGLSLVTKRLAELNGSIKCDSKIGEGSTFTVTLPLKNNN